MTERVQINSIANVSAGLADLVLTSSGSTGTKTSTFGASANLTSIILAIPEPPSVLFYGADQLGSTRLLTDSAGVVRGTFSYDAYGTVIGSTGANSTPLEWGGQYKDAESGFIYLSARYYDPATAEFLSRDPDVATTRAPYDYVAGNPLNSIDRSGLTLTEGGDEGTDGFAPPGAAGFDSGEGGFSDAGDNASIEPTYEPMAPETPAEIQAQEGTTLENCAETTAQARIRAIVDVDENGDVVPPDNGPIFSTTGQPDTLPPAQLGKEGPFRGWRGWWFVIVHAVSGNVHPGG
jgi:RHS repeat-associated protein